MNQAALIAVDCGMPGLAAELRERQFAIFQAAAAPVTGPAAIASLQPLVNLARLDIRTGQPGRGHQTLIQLAAAARSGGIVQAAGHSIALGTVAADDDGAVGLWLRGILLHDGTRALAAAGHWDKAAAHAAAYDEHPSRLRHTRQARVIASIADGNHDAALALISESTRTEPWEHAVAACLRAWTHLAAGRAIPATLVPALALAQNAVPPGSPGTIMFRVRLSLTAAELATAINPAWENLLGQTADDAIHAADTRAARDILASTAASLLSQAQHQRLVNIAADSGPGALSGPLHDDLMRAVSAAEEHLRADLLCPY